MRENQRGNETTVQPKRRKNNVEITIEFTSRKPKDGQDKDAESVKIPYIDESLSQNMELI
jgi:hypothetical protein